MMDETEYLNSGANKARLQHSIEQSKTSDISQPEVVIDVELVEGLLQHLEINELNYIKKVCDMLIAKTNI